VLKFRKKSLFGKIRQYLKGVFHELSRKKSFEIFSGHMASDHVHMCISIPPKYAVSEVIGYLKSKSGAPLNSSGKAIWR
jgi:putative transposase